MPKVTIPHHSPLAKLCQYPHNADDLAMIDNLIQYWQSTLKSPDLKKVLWTESRWTERAGYAPTQPTLASVSGLIESHIQKLTAIRNEQAKVVHSERSLEPKYKGNHHQLAIPEIKSSLIA